MDLPANHKSNGCRAKPGGKRFRAMYGLSIVNVGKTPGLVLCVRRWWMARPSWALSFHPALAADGGFARMMNSLKMTLTGVVLFGLLFPGYAYGAELRYIRIGEHKDYTRIVFEFRGTPAFKSPVVTKKGAFALTFLNATTALPSKIATETSERVEAMTFLKQPAGLKANVALAFPYFKIKAFRLANPDRVVLDISPLDQPPEGFLSQETPAVPTPVKPAGPSETKPVPRPQKTRPEKSLPPKGKQPQTMSRPAAQVEAPKKAQPMQPKDQGPTAVATKTPPSATTAFGRETRTPVLTEPAPSEADRPVNSVGRSPDQGVSRPSPGMTAGHLQTILLLALLALSLIMVGLLAVIVFRRRRKGASMPPEQPFEAGIMAEDDIADIDAQLKKKLAELD